MPNPHPPHNRCKEPGHVFSEATGRCLTCKTLNQRRYRAANRETLRVKQRTYQRARRQTYYSLESRLISAALLSWK